MVISRLKELSVEEVANSLTHGFGLLLSIAGLVSLLLIAAFNGGFWQITSSIIYGASLVTLYGASTLYHSTVSLELKRKLQVLDHCCIYLLIAGSYTPFALLLFRESFGFWLLAFVWSFAVFGIAMNLIFRNRYSVVSVISYLAMGWIGVFVVQPMYSALGLLPLMLVVGGGIAYSLGIVFFAWHRIRHHHAIFHIFVLVGSVIHFFAITVYVLR